jgi:hypothetical protein
MHKCTRARWGWIGCVRTRWRARAAGSAYQPETLTRASPCPSASTACGFGAQAFSHASAFNGYIGAWNTASVTTLACVCAAPGPAARTMADALGRASVRRGPLCAAAPPMRARVRTRAGTRLRGAMGVGMAAWRGGSIHAFEYMYVRVCVCVCYTTYLIHLSVYVRISRGYECVHQLRWGWIGCVRTRWRARAAGSA